MRRNLSVVVIMVLTLFSIPTLDTQGGEELRIEREKTLDQNREVIKISGDDDLRDVTASVSLNEGFQIKSNDRITLYWNEERKFVDFTLYDDNSNGIFDNITWIVEHLSNQTFVIHVTNAEHLNSSREFISNIFNGVKDIDGNWSEAINHSEYVRIWFDDNLTGTNDITLYVRNNESLNTTIDVYEFNTSNRLARFPIITSTKYYTIFLTNLTSPADKFDLRVNNIDNDSNAFLEFDHIIDPPQAVFCTKDGVSISCDGLIDIGDVSTSNVPSMNDNGCGNSNTLDECGFIDLGTGGDSFVEFIFNFSEVTNPISANVTIEYASEKQKTFGRLRAFCFDGTGFSSLGPDAINTEPDLNISFDLPANCSIQRIDDIRIRFGQFSPFLESGKLFFDFVDVIVTNVSIPPAVPLFNITNVIAFDQTFAIVKLNSVIERANVPYAQQGRELNFTEEFFGLKLGRNFTLSNHLKLGTLNREFVPNSQLGRSKEFDGRPILILNEARK